MFVGVVVLLGALLPMLAFWSIVIPLTTAVMHLLSAGAAFSVVVAVFRVGHEPARAGQLRTVEAFLPVRMVGILFGLSMDYQVFLVSRMHEEWACTGNNHKVMRAGQAATGRVIRAAAAIMIFVFGGQRIIAEFGLGLRQHLNLEPGHVAIGAEAFLTTWR